MRFEKKIGERVKQDEIIAKIETDKTTMEVLAPHAGIIEAYLVEDGSSIAANTPLIKLAKAAAGDQHAAAPAPPKAAPAPPAAAAKSEPVAQTPPPPPPRPSANVEAPPPLPKMPISATPVSHIAVTPPSESSGVTIGKITGTRTETAVKMSKMRQTVASRLKTAQNTCAMLTTFNEINMGNLVEMRKQFGEQFQKKHQLKLGFMSAFLKASAAALLDQPVVNAVIENNEIIYRDYVDISFAAATPKVTIINFTNAFSLSYYTKQQGTFHLFVCLFV